MLEMNVTSLPVPVDKARIMVRKFGRKTITRMAQYARAIEKNSMLEAPKGHASSPGTPPHAHPRRTKSGNVSRAKIFRDFIEYKVEPQTSDPFAVVGPTKPNTGRGSNWAERIGKTHEFGGEVQRVANVYYNDGKSTSIVLWSQGQERGEKTFPFEILEKKTIKRGKKIRYKYKISYRAVYPQRPFAQPALDKVVARGQAGKFDNDDF